MEDDDSQKHPVCAGENYVLSQGGNGDYQTNQETTTLSEEVVHVTHSIGKPHGAISIGNTESRSQLPSRSFEIFAHEQLPPPPSTQQDVNSAQEQVSQMQSFKQDVNKQEQLPSYLQESALYVWVMFPKQQDRAYLERFICEKLAAFIDDIEKVKYGDNSIVILLSNENAALEIVKLLSLEESITEVELIKKLFQRILSENSLPLRTLKEKYELLENDHKELTIKRKFIPIAEYEVRSQEIEAIGAKIEECKQQEKEFTNYVESLLTTIVSPKMEVSMLDTLNLKMNRERKHLTIGLPIYSRRSEIVEVITRSNVTVLVGETGSGKSTQVIQYIYDAGIGGNGIIVCTQPRKVAAISLANRVCEEMDVCLGDKLGYKVGMSERCCKNTRILFMTDHMLLNECIADCSLSKYSCILIDEAHERSINTDMLLAFLKQCLPNRRSNLKLVIMSATIEPELFVRYFKMGDGHECNVVSTIKVSGRTFPVEVEYDPLNNKEELSPTNDYVTNAVKVVDNIHSAQPPGDILVFLTCAPDIEKACTKLVSFHNDATILPLHGKLPPEEQQKVFQKTSNRKIIFSTNVAETSITIPGVKYVVDTGLAKEMHFDSRKGMDSLEVCTISKSSAEQRKGRAGRVSAGKCYRLYSNIDYESRMQERTKPEILRIQLTQVVLKMLQFGVPNVLKFDYVEAPDQIALESAVNTLECIGAIAEDQLTELGKKMAVIPLQPQLSKILLDSVDADIGTEALISVALSSLAGQVFFRGGTDEMKEESDTHKLKYCHKMGDQMTNLSVYQCWQEKDKDQQKKWCKDNFVNSKSMHIVQETIKELRMILKTHLKIKVEMSIKSLDAAECYLSKLYFDAFINNLAVYLGHHRAGYMATALPNGDPFIIFPGSSLNYLGSTPTYVIYERTLKTSRQFLTNVLSVKQEWVDEAIRTGRLAEDPAVTFLDHMCVPFHAKYTGPQTSKEIFFRIKQGNMFDCSSGVPSEIDFSLEPKQWGVIRAIAQKKKHSTVKFAVENTAKEIHKRMMEATEELGLTCSQDTTRVVIGLGGSVKQIIMPYHFRSVIAICADQSRSLGYLKTFFQQCGEVKEIKTLQEKPILRVRITYATLFQAQEAIKMSCSDVHIHPFKGQQFSLKLEWERRQRAPYASVSFDSVINRDNALTKLGSCICYHGERIKITNDKWNDCKLFLSSRIFLEVDEIQFKDHLNTFNVGNFSVRIGYKQYNGEYPYVECSSRQQQYNEDVQENQSENDDTSSEYDGREDGISDNENVTERAGNNAENLQLFKHRTEEFLTLVVNKYMGSGTCRVNFVLPQKWHIKYRAYITFNDPDEGYRVLYSDLNRETVHGQQLSVCPILKCTLTFRQNIFTLIRHNVEKAIKELRCLSSNIFIRVFSPDKKFKDVTRVSLTAHDVMVFSKAQNMLYKVAEPSVLECYTTELREYIQSQNIQKEIEDIQINTSTFISRDINIMVIKIYGTSENKDQAKCRIEEKAKDMFSDGATVIHLSLRGNGRPPGLMKYLTTTYKCDLSDLLSFEGVRKVTLTPNRHQLSVVATSVGLETIERCIEQMSALPRVPTTKEYDFDCSACFTQIDNHKDMFRLEQCGHGFHIDCIEMQLKNNTIVFPICCAYENCSEKFVLKDFQNLQKRVKSFRMPFLVSMAVQDFMTKNSDTYKNCPTPDCKMIYPQADISKPFSCSSCFVVTCSKCHKQYHHGISCELYAKSHKSDEELLQWMREDPENRKRCPKCAIPIEKNEGCSHMLCKCGTHICWMCMMTFSTETKCYYHQSQCTRWHVTTHPPILAEVHPIVQNPDVIQPITPPEIDIQVPVRPQQTIPQQDIPIQPYPRQTIPQWDIPIHPQQINSASHAHQPVHNQPPRRNEGSCHIL